MYELESLATDAGVPFFSDAASLLSAVQPDGVVVATPTEHHLEPVLTALAAGAHVLVEKPITPTLAQAQAIIKAVAEYDRQGTGGASSSLLCTGAQSAGAGAAGRARSAY